MPIADRIDGLTRTLGYVGMALATVQLVIPATRVNSLIWLVAGWWSGLLAALTIFTIGIIFLIATVLLLAAFVRANW